MNIGYIVPLSKLKYNLRPFLQLEIDELRRRGYKVKPMVKEMVHSRLSSVDLIISHYMSDGNLIKNKGIPFITIYHGSTYGPNIDILRELQDNKNCKAIGIDSLFHLERFQSEGYHKIFYTPVAVRTELFKRNKPLGDKIIGGGRLIPIKGFDIALRACSDMWIFGDEISNNKEYVDQLRNLSKPNHILGWKFGDELKDLMEDSWLYIHPSIPRVGKLEGPSSTFKEAMLMELQLISTNLGGISELKYINFVDPNEESIRSKIDSLEHKNNIEGRDFIREHYNPKVCVDYLEELINI